MYMLYCVDSILDQAPYWAHTHEKKTSELLHKHMEKCMEYFESYCVKKGMDKIIINTIKDCGINDIQAAYDLFVNAIYMHDMGKINPRFQRDVLGNRYFKKSYDGDTRHSMASAFIYIDRLYPKIKHNKVLSYVLFNFAYIISRHHGSLKSTDDFLQQLDDIRGMTYYSDQSEEWMEDIISTEEGPSQIRKMLKLNEIPFYMLNKLLFALITACDYCATYEYINGHPMELSVIESIDKLQSTYRKGEIYKGIQAYKQNADYFAHCPINALRSEMFLETEKRLEENAEGKVFYLEAPTGSGKTNMSVNLALKLAELSKEVNNIFYIFPFNTLVEQTADILNQYFPGQTAVINSITPVMMDDDEAIPSYEKAYINRQFFNYPIVVTSHVNLFSALFGCDRENGFALTKLCNSVVILDEIQSYKNSIWRQLIMMLDRYARLLNIKIIIMSATLPKMDRLLGKESNGFIELVKDVNKYYLNPIFKDRVKIDFSMLDNKKIDLNVLADKVLEFKDRKVLVEFITKGTAREFYNIIKGRCEYVEELTGDDNKLKRNEVIEKIKKQKSIIVIATQVIEAGIDIDMDIGFKDTSIPDSEEQFLGRINRSCRKIGCIAFFFNYDNPQVVYRNDVRTNYPITDQMISEMLEQKKFGEIYELVLRDVFHETELLNNKNISLLLRAALISDFEKIEKQLRLIERTAQLYLAYQITLEEEIIDGREIWYRFRQLCADKEKGYAQKKVELSRLAEKMSYFTYNIYNIEDKTFRYDEEFAGYYYIENGEQFIIDGKFDRKAFSMEFGGRFL
ncbi:CRISPR-associated helicase Cas3' [Petroclostridium sp. X23]|uniref:CRISPR-associated helicase Cas3' n=1 Tax=Petroclostridium sp. X23 TaxID=3045146 RepID=UPI0024ACEAF4|nr:CRISPR-associated helicase Cas3' [Petroclostridium sp. X23]WHH59321.1 CRISPR-associated helicase Cas3' [Petroclostridium sp. X23]